MQRERRFVPRPEGRGLCAKLQMKSGYRVLLLHPPEGYPEALAPLPEGVEIVNNTGLPVNLVLVFVDQRAVLDASLPQIIPVLDASTLFWIAYRKGGSKAGTDLNRDRLWEALAPWNWNPVTLIALDDRWSAMRFRPTSR
jgi:hypothetical protein